MKIIRIDCVLFVVITMIGFSSDRATARDGLRARGDRARCQSDCRIATDEFVQQCLEEGGTPPVCAAAARRFNLNCKRACKGQEACEGVCRQLGDSAYDECIAAGNPQEKCEAIAEQVAQECIKTNCNAPPPCAEVCIDRAVTALTECVQSGGIPPQCFGAARAALEDCLFEFCNLPRDCNDLCAMIAEATYALCLEGGLGELECGLIRSETFDICFATRCEADECKAACLADALDLLRQCRAGGGTTIECAAEALRFFDRCGADCDALCDGVAMIPCPTGFFCKHEVGRCDVADDTGLCRVRPLACPDVWEPVCGCDGLTYGNECEADATGVSIDHLGECAKEP